MIVVGPLPKDVGAAVSPRSRRGRDTAAALDGDWSVTLNGGRIRRLRWKSWDALGAAGFAGPATYKKQFTAAAVAKGKRVYLEMGDVHDYAKVTLNGKDLGARAWGPYRWDATAALKKGANELVVEVWMLLRRRGVRGRVVRYSCGMVPAAPPAVGIGCGSRGLPAGAGARRRQGAAGAGTVLLPQQEVARRTCCCSCGSGDLLDCWVR